MRLTAVCLALGVLLTACGGGGGGDAPAAGGGAADAPAPVTLDSANYVQASTEAASSALFMLDKSNPSLALGVDSTDANEVLQFGLNQVPSLGSWFKGAAIATGVVKTEIQPCAGGGSIAAIITDADNNSILSAGDSITLTANNCQKSGLATMNGAVTFTVVALTGDLDSTSYDASLRLTYNNLSAVTPTSSVYGNGEITLSASASAEYARTQSLGSTSFTARASYGTASYSRTLTNFKSALTMAANSPASMYKTSSTVDGTVASSALADKSVTMATITPFVRLNTNSFPSSGQATVTGASAAKVRLTVQNATTVLLELDANADGIYETSTIKSWFDIR